MGEFKAGTLFLGLTTYFIFLVLFLTMVENTSTTYGLDYGITTNGNSSLLSDLDYYTNTNTCHEPRSAINLINGEYEELAYSLQTTAECFATEGALNEEKCNSINGCSWENETIFFFFQGTDQSCEGDINITTYTTENVTIQPLTHRVKNELGIAEFCTLDGFDKDTCEQFGCEWGKLDREDIVGTSNMLDITGSLFTFQATFSDNPLLNLLLTTFLFYLPLIALAIAIYFMLPVIH